MGTGSAPDQQAPGTTATSPSPSSYQSTSQFLPAAPGPAAWLRALGDRLAAASTAPTGTTGSVTRGDARRPTPPASGPAVATPTVAAAEARKPLPGDTSIAQEPSGPPVAAGDSQSAVAAPGSTRGSLPGQAAAHGGASSAPPAQGHSFGTAKPSGLEPSNVSQQLGTQLPAAGRDTASPAAATAAVSLTAGPEAPLQLPGGARLVGASADAMPGAAGATGGGAEGAQGSPGAAPLVHWELPQAEEPQQPGALPHQQQHPQHQAAGKGVQVHGAVRGLSAAVGALSGVAAAGQLQELLALAPAWAAAPDYERVGGWARG